MSLKRFQQEENIVDASRGSGRESFGVGSVYQKTLNETNSGIRETEQKIAVLDGQDWNRPKATISSNTNITVNPVYQQMQTKLTQLELERDGLLAAIYRGRSLR